MKHGINGTKNGARITAPVLEKKQPKTLSLTPSIVEAGEMLAVQDRRDFSAEVSWLIEQEHARRGGVA